jgi:hypothetical protein
MNAEPNHPLSEDDSVDARGEEGDIAHHSDKFFSNGASPEIDNNGFPIIQLCLATASLRDFCGEHIDPFYVGWFGQQLRRFRHQRRRDLPRQMSFAACLIGKRIEDAECRRPEPQGEPHLRRGFLIRESKPTLKEAGDLGFLSRLGLQSHE